MTNPKEITREEMVEAMADPKEMAERLRVLSDALGDGRFNDNEDDAMTCHEAATLIERLTVEGLAGVIEQAVSQAEDLVLSHDGKIPAAIMAGYVSKAILDHLTTGTEVHHD